MEMNKSSSHLDLASIHHFEVLDSTNDLARQWIVAGAPAGTVIVAKNQTAGRGRQGRSWATIPGSLLFSMILRPNWAAEQANRIGLYACVAGALAAEKQTGSPGWIKWPNDLVLPKLAAKDAGPTARPQSWAKWGGILVETGVSSGRCEWAILGVGLNLSSPGNAVQPCAFTFSSLGEYSGTDPDGEAFLSSYLSFFQGLYAAVLGGDWERGLAEWRKRDVLTGRMVSVDSSGDFIIGFARGIDDLGRLLIDTDEGILSVAAGDVHLLGIGD